jgi:hypothetical protein
VPFGSSTFDSSVFLPPLHSVLPGAYSWSGQLVAATIVSGFEIIKSSLDSLSLVSVESTTQYRTIYQEPSAVSTLYAAEITICQSCSSAKTISSVASRSLDWAYYSPEVSISVLLRLSSFIHSFVARLSSLRSCPICWSVFETQLA